MSTLIHHEQVTLDAQGGAKVVIAPDRLYDVSRASYRLLRLEGVSGAEGEGTVADQAQGWVRLFAGTGPDGAPKAGAQIMGGEPGAGIVLNVYQD